MDKTLMILSAIIAERGSLPNTILIKGEDDLTIITKTIPPPLRCLECGLFEFCPFC